MNNQTHFIERFEACLNPSTDGTNGRFRGDKAKLLTQIDDDRAAINIFLDQTIKNPGTKRMYAREIERLQMWAVMVKEKSIADLEMSDFDEYIKFIKTPPKGWVADKRYPKSSENWRPFVRDLNEHGRIFELSENALFNAISAINTMMDWLVSCGYLTGNTLGLIRKNMKKAIRMDSHEDKVERFLDDETVEDVKHVIMSMPSETDLELLNYERARFIFTMFIMLGSRISELANSQMRDFSKEPAGWFWKVTGKGNKSAKVVVPEDMLIALSRWRKVLKLSPYPLRTEITPVIPMINRHAQAQLNRAGITPRRINQILSEIFEATIKHIQETQSGHKAEEKITFLQNASAHWLRHTSITQKTNSGMAHHAVQMDARHSDPRTTQRYIHDQEKERVEEAKKHKMTW